jgi:hypothetical protein
VLHSSAPGYSVSFSLSAPLCPEVNMNTDPYPLKIELYCLTVWYD